MLEGFCDHSLHDEVRVQVSEIQLTQMLTLVLSLESLLLVAKTPESVLAMQTTDLLHLHIALLYFQFRVVSHLLMRVRRTSCVGSPGSVATNTAGKCLC